MSPPTRGRGLKSVDGREDPKEYDVAPHAGAWVEIISGSVLPVS